MNRVASEQPQDEEDPTVSILGPCCTLPPLKPYTPHPTSEQHTVLCVLALPAVSGQP